MESKLLNLAINGDRRSLGKILTKIESGFEPNISLQKPWTLGVTGPPGAGKSTLIGALISRWIKKGEKIAVLAVDPSSPKSGGALLADRFRMQGSEKSESIFIDNPSIMWSGKNCQIFDVNAIPGTEYVDATLSISSSNPPTKENWQIDGLKLIPLSVTP